VTKGKDDATSDITTTANNAKTSVQDTASTAASSIDSKTTEATEHVDAKVTEFNKTVEDNGFLTPEKLTEDLTALNWQKYKLTGVDGSKIQVSLSDSIDNLHNLEPGQYYATGIPITVASSTSGFVNVELSAEKTVKHIIFRPFNSTQIWLKRFYNTWSEWERVDNTQTDTGWIPYSTINGVGKNVVYKNSGDNGFDCGYRIIKDGNVTRRILRVNVNNLTQGVIFAELPSSFSKHTQVMSVRTPRDLNGGLVEIKPDGKLIFQYYKTSRDWASTDYAYGEFSWVE